MNLERLQHTLKLLEQMRPEEFNIDHWTTATTCCAFGAECKSEYGKANGLRLLYIVSDKHIPQYGQRTGYGAVVDYYGINLDQAFDLFSARVVDQEQDTLDAVKQRLSAFIACEQAKVAAAADAFVSFVTNGKEISAMVDDVAAVFDRAADIMEQRGKCELVRKDRRGSVCALGALQLALGKRTICTLEDEVPDSVAATLAALLPERYSLLPERYSYISDARTRRLATIAHWSNHNTQDKVVAGLRAAAVVLKARREQAQPQAVQPKTLAFAA